ncbi:UNVERIFIED_CONTAM: hypothetical protein GTU68_054201, partial [Idotea baltica]|nr:hypothetical protein [Idotea baltica]
RCPLGWEGPQCDKCLVYPGCLHGTCNKSWECNCKEGWGGPFCNQDLNYCTNHSPCKNGATCFNTKPGSYSCQCPSGFNGTNCEILKDSCSNAPCQNGGTCLDTGNEGFSFRCVCPVGYSGPKCETNVDDCAHTPCLNGGPCLDDIDSFKCRCRPGFVGDLCQTDVDDCVTRPCANGGTCLDRTNDFQCKCRPGWKGRHCNEQVPLRSPCASSPCDNGGACKEAPELSVGYRCYCPPGVLGPRCTVPQHSQVQSSPDEAVPMSALQIVLIVTFSVAVPALAVVSIAAIACMKRRRRREMCRQDEEARRQNEQNAVHNAANKNNLTRGMIFNSLDYPSKPLNTELPPPAHKGDPDYPPSKKNCSPLPHENAYSIVPTRSTKTLNTDASRLSLASRLEKDLDAYTLSRNSPVDPCGGGGGIGVSKTPDPHLPRTHSHR